MGGIGAYKSRLTLLARLLAGRCPSFPNSISFLAHEHRFFHSLPTPPYHYNLLLPSISPLFFHLKEGCITRTTQQLSNRLILMSLSTTTRPPDEALGSTNIEAKNDSSPEGSAEKEGNTEAEKPKEESPRGRAVRGSPVSWLSLVLLCITGAGLLYFFDKEKQRRLEALRQGSAEVTVGPSVGKAAIGGPFKLINHEGKQMTDKDFLGNWTVIYFGFTHCPDICPEELSKIVEAINIIEKKSGIKINPVFISVDPERDNVEQIREYVKEFHPRLVGLTGTPEEIRQVARAYRVYYMKANEDESDYLVDHSIITYLMDPNMEFVKFFGKNYDVNSLSDGILEEIKKSKYSIL